MKEKILIFLQKNYGWIVAILTGFTVITSFILRFIKYLYSTFYFNYFGLTYSLFDSSELNFLYNYGFSILLLLCFSSLSYCFIQLLSIRKWNIKIGTVISNILLIVFCNTIFVIAANTNFLFYQIILDVLILIAIEFISIFVFSKISKKKDSKETTKLDVLNCLKILPFYLVLLVIVFITSYGYGVLSNKSYRIVNNDKVIVYTTTNYYLLLDAEITGNDLIIYRGTQSKIDNENIESKLVEFDSVIVK